MLGGYQQGGLRVPMYKFTTALGRSIKTASNHPYLVKVESEWKKVSELNTEDEIVAQKNLVAPDSNSVGFYNKEAASQNFGSGLFEEYSRAPGNFALSQSFNIDNYYAFAGFDIEADDIAKIFIKSKQDTLMLQGVMEDFLVTSLAQPFFRSQLYFETKLSEIFYYIGIDALVSKDIHNGLFLQKNFNWLFAQLGGEFNSGNNIFLGNTGILLGNFINGISACEQIEDVSHGYSCAPDTGLAKPYSGVNSNFFHNIINHFFFLQKQLYHNLVEASSSIHFAYAQLAGIKQAYDIKEEDAHNFIKRKFPLPSGERVRVRG